VDGPGRDQQAVTGADPVLAVGQVLVAAGSLDADDVLAGEHVLEVLDLVRVPGDGTPGVEGEPPECEVWCTVGFVDQYALLEAVGGVDGFVFDGLPVAQSWGWWHAGTFALHHSIAPVPRRGPSGRRTATTRTS